MTATDAGKPEAGQPATGAGRFRLGVSTIFFGVLLVLLAVYLQMAMGMEWRTAAGRIGPGFFPRVIGVLGVVLTLVALVRSLRPRADATGDLGRVGRRASAGRIETVDGEELGGADLGRHPGTTVVVIAASAALAAAFVTLGAVVACALYLFGCLWLLNRPHPIQNAVLSLGIAVGLYLLFETALGAGLPAGVLPLPR